MPESLVLPISFTLAWLQEGAPARAYGGEHNCRGYGWGDDHSNGREVPGCAVGPHSRSGQLCTTPVALTAGAGHRTPRSKGSQSVPLPCHAARAQLGAL